MHNIQNIINEVSQAHTQEIEENYKLAQHNLEKIVEQYNEELIETKRELNKMHQNVAIYKNNKKTQVLPSLQKYYFNSLVDYST